VLKSQASFLRQLFAMWRTIILIFAVATISKLNTYTYKITHTHTHTHTHPVYLIFNLRMFGLYNIS